VRIGTDIQIISCDNEAEMLSLMDPPPESIDLNRKAVARLAVERLLWRMKNGPAAPSVVITVSPALAGRNNLQLPPANSPLAQSPMSAPIFNDSMSNIDVPTVAVTPRREHGQQQSSVVPTARSLTGG
jgi:hypothetical protein